MFEIDRFIVQAVIREDDGRRVVNDHLQPQQAVFGADGLKKYLRQLEKDVEAQNRGQQP